MHALTYSLRAEIPQTLIDQHVAPEYFPIWQVVETCVSATPCEVTTMEHIVDSGLILADAYRVLVEALRTCVTCELIAVPSRQ